MTDSQARSTAEEARARAQEGRDAFRASRIAEASGQTRDDLAAAYRHRDWRTLGYDSWESYLLGEFGRAGVEYAARYRIGLTDAPRPPDTRHVYFIQAVAGGPIKIGVATRPADRLAEIQRMSPVPLRILGIVPGVGAAGEADLHREFAKARQHGEWFEPTPELLSYIAMNAAGGAR